MGMQFQCEEPVSQKLYKNKLFAPLLGLSVGIMGILPAYISLNSLFHYHDEIGRDPTLLNIILISGTVALAFFLFGYWVYQGSRHVGLEIHIEPGRVTLTTSPIFGNQTTEIIDWNQVHHIVMTEMPRQGETLYFHDHHRSASWHTKAFSLKLNESSSDQVFRHFKQSASAAGFELHRTKRLITIIFDRYVWDVRPRNSEQTP